MSYAEGAERRKYFGAGLVELHNRVGILADKYGVGVWAQNRPEWQLAGESWLMPWYIQRRTTTDSSLQNSALFPSRCGLCRSMRRSAPKRASTSSTTASWRVSSALCHTLQHCSG